MTDRDGTHYRDTFPGRSRWKERQYPDGSTVIAMDSYLGRHLEFGGLTSGTFRYIGWVSWYWCYLIVACRLIIPQRKWPWSISYLYFLLFHISVAPCTMYMKLKPHHHQQNNYLIWSTLVPCISIRWANIYTGLSSLLAANFLKWKILECTVQ
jgi:hypothetical protein